MKLHVKTVIVKFIINRETEWTIAAPLPPPPGHEVSFSRPPPCNKPWVLLRNTSGLGFSNFSTNGLHVFDPHWQLDLVRQCGCHDLLVLRRP